MSSENINSTTAPATEPTFTIDGKDYKKSELSTKTYNSIIVRQDLQATKIKLSLNDPVNLCNDVSVIFVYYRVLVIRGRIV